MKLKRLLLIPLFASICLITTGYSFWFFDNGSKDNKNIGVNVSTTIDSGEFNIVGFDSLSLELDQSSSNNSQGKGVRYLSNGKELTSNPTISYIFKNNEDLYYRFNLELKIKTSLENYVDLGFDVNSILGSVSVNNKGDYTIYSYSYLPGTNGLVIGNSNSTLNILTINKDGVKYDNNKLGEPTTIEEYNKMLGDLFGYQDETNNIPNTSSNENLIEINIEAKVNS